MLPDSQSALHCLYKCVGQVADTLYQNHIIQPKQKWQAQLGIGNAQQPTALSH